MGHLYGTWVSVTKILLNIECWQCHCIWTYIIVQIVFIFVLVGDCEDTAEELLSSHQNVFSSNHHTTQLAMPQSCLNYVIKNILRTTDIQWEHLDYVTKLQWKLAKGILHWLNTKLVTWEICGNSCWKP